MIGERMKLARESAGLSLGDLAEKISHKVSRQALSKYELDQMKPGADTLRLLARALGVTERYLLNPSRIDITGVEVVSKMAGSNKEIASLKAKVLSAFERYADIEDMVPAAEVTWALPAGFPFQIEKIDEVEVAAARLRAAWELGRGPLPRLSEVLEDRGIKVFALDFDQSFSGVLCMITRGNQPPAPVLAVNKSDPGECQRFGIARELARLILDVRNADEAEKAFERFARAFLMLQDVFIAAVGKNRTSLPQGELFRLKAVFQVSVIAITRRCVELGIIDDGERRRLFEIFDRMNWTKQPRNEPTPTVSETPTRFERLCMRALAEGIISESRAAEALSVSTWRLGPVIDAHGWQP